MKIKILLLRGRETYTHAGGHSNRSGIVQRERETEREAPISQCLYWIQDLIQIGYPQRVLVGGFKASKHEF